MNTLDERLSRLFARVAPSPDFESRLMTRIRHQSVQEPDRAAIALRASQRLHTAGRRRLRLWLHMMIRTFALDVLGAGSLLVVLAAAWPRLIAHLPLQGAKDVTLLLLLVGPLMIAALFAATQARSEGADAPGV